MPGDGHSRVWSARQSRPHSSAREHRSEDGTSLRSICRAGEELGLATRAVKSATGHLDQMPTAPTIVHWDKYRWIVVVTVDRKHVKVIDPALGRRTLARAELESRWSGYAALFDYTPDFEQAPQATRRLAWTWSLVRPHAGLLAQGLGLAVVVSALQMVLPVFTQVIVDRVLVDQDLLAALSPHRRHGHDDGVHRSVAVVAAGLVSFSAVRIDAAALDYITRRLLALVLPMSYFASRRTGDLQRRLEGVRHVPTSSPSMASPASLLSRSSARPSC